MGRQANAAAQGFAARADGRTVEVAQRAARTIAVAVRLLRVPTAVLGAVPLPFIATTMLLGLLAGGAAGVVIGVAGLAMAAVSAFFWIRRARLIRAVEDPDRLATELAILVSLTDKVDETCGALAEIAGGGGWRVLGRLRGV